MQARLLVSTEPGFPQPAELARFVAAHARGGLLVRDAAMMADAIKRGLLVAIIREEPELPSAEDPLLAMAGIFPLAEGKFELGGALVREDATGFRLQDYMVEARLAENRHNAIAPWSELYSGAAHAEYGKGSRRLLERFGFEPIPHDQAPVEFRNECARCPRSVPEGADCCYQMFLAGQASAQIDSRSRTVDLVRSRDGMGLSLHMPGVAAA